MSDSHQPLTLLCIATYFKGVAFLEEAKRQGCRVLLLTVERLAEADWPRDSLDGIYYVPLSGDEWNQRDTLKGVSYLARTEQIDRIVALDDFDLEKAAVLREHLRVPGMGDTRTRFFRDKLAMRMQAQEAGIRVPPFVHVLNNARIRAFTEAVPPPWIVKPRSMASAIGIKKVRSTDELWGVIDRLGDERVQYVLERFVPGDIYHVDSIVFDEEVVFARAHRYFDPPLQVAHEGGIFATHNIAYGSREEVALREMNEQVMQAMGLRRGVSHTEFIHAQEDDRFYFLETSARVGGAHIAETLEASSGINLWCEWAKIEALRPDASYTLPDVRQDYAGILISLARQEHPDTSAYNDPEIVWRMSKRHHAGLIVRSSDLDRVTSLLRDYTRRFYQDFHTSQPAPERPTA